MDDVTIVVDEDDLFASHDADGMIITFTDACSPERLSPLLLKASENSWDMGDQYFDNDLQRTVLLFGKDSREA